MSFRLALTFALFAAVTSLAQTPTPVPTPPGDRVVYQPKYEDPVIKEMEDAGEARAKAADEATAAVRERQKQKKDEDEKAEQTLRFDMSKIVKPVSPAVFNAPFHFPPVAQYLTGTCWSFSTTSFYESEVARLTGQKIKLSEIHTVYWEYVEKMRRYVRERGDSLIAEGSESNAVNRIWRQYGVVPAEAYPGVLSPEGRHDHSRLLGRLDNLAAWLKQHDEWDEELAIAMTRVILDRELGPPPATFTWQGATYTPTEFLARVLRLDLDAYVEVMSTLSLPFYQRGEFKVPDNWWHSRRYYNVRLDDFAKVIRHAVGAGRTLCLDIDNTEPGFCFREGFAVVPTFDIAPAMIDDAARQMRFSNAATTDDHLVHLVGSLERDGRMWYLIKDSGTSGWNSSHKGYMFYREDYIRLKTLSAVMSRDIIEEALVRGIGTPP